ncbi:hypothetical protein EK21DRAFT_95478 [Setomelanomma holmii]|uniref:Uncharacterized protein n=1 Tax=Setomelanomma holmii TaxID=210430 RepID=A0A9P4GWC9_9PLEO|nr:hypothetical protein EK21DRAFT_95478 [Setomelanomma holmii]
MHYPALLTILIAYTSLTTATPVRRDIVNCGSLQKKGSDTGEQLKGRLNDCFNIDNPDESWDRVFNAYCPMCYTYSELNCQGVMTWHGAMGKKGGPIADSKSQKCLTP